MVTVTLKDHDNGEEFILTLHRETDEGDGWDSFLALTEDIIYMWMRPWVPIEEAMVTVREMHQRFLETMEPQRHGGEA